jgi:dihydrofolate synthase/folylpolyglutamate synthase
MKALSSKLAKFGSRPGLERIKKIMETFGNPQDKLHVILVTGTNGKGSVVSYLSSILKEAGKKVGSYYSPHLIEYNERIRINNVPISDAKFKKYEKKILGLFKSGMEMTEFEALTAVAYCYFFDEKVDFAIMEIGMGGALDATNIANAEIGIITNVALDHTEYLGNTVEDIAREKAGIVKRGVCITGASGSALEEIKKAATKNNVTINVLNRDFFVEVKNCSVMGNEFNFIGRNFYPNLCTSLFGRYQIDNAALALAAAEHLDTEEGAIRKGLRKAENAGRLQVIGKKPLVIIDAAHNPAGIGTTLSCIEELFNYEKLIVVFGARKTKDWKAMIELLAKHAESLVITEAKTDTLAEETRILARFAVGVIETKIEKEPKKALKLAIKGATKKDMVLVCGSIYLLGEILNQSTKFKVTDNSVTTVRK